MTDTTLTWQSGVPPEHVLLLVQWVMEGFCITEYNEETKTFHSPETGEDLPTDDVERWVELP